MKENNIIISKVNAEYRLDSDFDNADTEEVDNTKIKNKIINILDNLPFSRYHMWIIASLGVFWILDGYEVSLLSVLSGVLKGVFFMSDSEIGLCGSLYLFGCVVGSLLFGYLSSIKGRKFLFTVTLVIYAISITATAVAVNKYMFMVCRFFTGISVGGEYSSIFAAIDELIPPSVRGRADIITDGTWHFGSTLASIFSFLTLNYFQTAQEVVVRMLFLIGVVLALPVIYLRRSIPESPRWLMYKGQYKEAVNVVRRIQMKCRSKQNMYNSEDQERLIVESNTDSSNEISARNVQNQTVEDIKFTLILKELFVKHRTRFFYALTLMASQAFFYNGIFYTYTLVLQNFYHIPKEKAGLYLIPLSIASFTGPLALGKFYDSWSRRKMIALTFALSGLLLTFTAFNFITNTFNFTIQQILWFLTFFIASPAASSAHLTVSEIFPIELRSQAMAIFFSFGLGIGGVCAPFIYGTFIEKDNKFTIFCSYLLAAFIMLFASVIGYCFGVDAENKSLEQISKDIREEEKEEDKGKQERIANSNTNTNSIRDLEDTASDRKVTVIESKNEV